MEWENVHSLKLGLGVLNSNARDAVSFRGVKVGEDGAKKVSKKINKNLKCIGLDLGNCELGEGGSKIILQMLNNPNLPLQVLRLDSNHISSSSLTVLEHFKSENDDETVANYFLKELDLSNNQINEEGAASLAKMLDNSEKKQGLAALKKLLLRGNETIGDTGAVSIAAALSGQNNHKGLEFLDLTQCGFGRNGCIAFGNAIKENTTLHTLILRENSMDLISCVSMSEALKLNSTLETLDVSSNGFGHYGAYSFSEALKENIALRSLDISDNKVNEDVCNELGAALAINKGLKHLNMADNNIQDGGAREIISGVLASGTVTSIDLSGNNISEAGAKHISAVLETGETAVPLKKLVLANNDIRDKGSKYIASALKANDTLNYLDLSKNNLRDEGGKHIADALLTNRSLQTLILAGNAIETAGLVALTRVLEENSSIFHLQLNDKHKDIVSNKMKDLHEKKQQLAKEMVLSGIKSMESESVHWNRSKLMVVGKEGAGKTALVRSILGQSFNPNRQATAGVNTSSSILLRKTSSKNVYKWMERDNSQSDLDEIILRAGRKELEKRHQSLKKISDASNSTVQNSPPSLVEKNIVQETSPSFVSDEEDNMNSKSENIPPKKRSSKKEKDSLEEEMFPNVAKTGPNLNPKQMRKKKMRKSNIRSSRPRLLDEEDLDRRYKDDIVSKIFMEKRATTDDTLTFMVWDYGGQRVFYSFHHLFLTNQGIYLLVFNLGDLLSENERTVADAIAYLSRWTNTILLHGSSQAPVLLVGTKLDLLLDGKNVNDNPDILKIDKILREDIDAISGNKLKLVSNGDLKFFPIDNTTKRGVGAVQAAIELIAKDGADVNQNVPLRWIRCFDMMIHDQHTSYLRMNEVRVMADQCGIRSDEEIQKMLRLLHQLGVIVYLTATAALRDVVTIDPQWLIDNILKVIPRENDPEWGETSEDLKKADLHQDWEAFFQTSIVNRNLLEYFWDEDGNDAEFMIDLLQRAMIMCKWDFGKVDLNYGKPSKVHRRFTLEQLGLGKEHEELTPEEIETRLKEYNAEDNQLYFVPSVLPERPEIFDHALESTHLSKCVFDFSNEFLPDGVFERLLSLCVAYSGTLYARDSDAIKAPLLSKHRCKIWFGKQLAFYLFEYKDTHEIHLLVHDEENANPARILDILMSMMDKLNHDVMANGLEWDISFESKSADSNGQLIAKTVAEKTPLSEFSRWFSSNDSSSDDQGHADTDYHVFLELL